MFLLVSGVRNFYFDFFFLNLGPYHRVGSVRDHLPDEKQPRAHLTANLVQVMAGNDCLFRIGAHVFVKST